jgi:Fe-S cluster assembly iron-binding protein IscA
MKAEEKARQNFQAGGPKWAAMETEAEKTRPALPTDDKGAGVLTVTSLAAKKLREAIRSKTTDPTAGFRLTRSPDNPNQIKMNLDNATDSDQVIKSEGVIILLMDSEVVHSMEGMVIDYKETPQGGGLSISKRSTGT